MLSAMSDKTEKSTSKPIDAPSLNEGSESDTSYAEGIGVPDHVAVPAALAGSGSLDRLVDTARDYARQATAENTTKAYAKDWKHFASWCRRRGANPSFGTPVGQTRRAVDQAGCAGCRYPQRAA